MRTKSKWTPGGIALWLIAAILATVIVCSEAPPKPDEIAPADEVEVDVRPHQ